ncbi:hypothetical protein QCA50_005331 [Cerrena zonata]|uniref:Uncharacterized protein n=1 Tax=Cerrena zonata TaxID=2478898 RepID=A0AAW0GEV2_9APHY
MDVVVSYTTRSCYDQSPSMEETIPASCLSSLVYPYSKSTESSDKPSCIVIRARANSDSINNQMMSVMCRETLMGPKYAQNHHRVACQLTGLVHGRLKKLQGLCAMIAFPY